MKSFRPIVALLGVFALASCGDKNGAQNISAPTAGAAVKFFNFGVGDPAVDFYANDQKLTTTSMAACSSPIDGKTTDQTCLGTGVADTTGTPYGGSANGTNGLYTSIAPGTYTLSGRTTSKANPGVTISNTPATIADGKFYTYYLSGIYNTTSKAVEGFVVEDPLPAIDYQNASVRFVNAISNSQPMTLFAKEQTSGVETAIGSTVAYKNAGAFTTLAPGIYDLSTRVAGSGTNVITRTGVSFFGGRVYTITAYGDITATIGKPKPALDNTANR
jgi:hypothetical protein